MRKVPELPEVETVKNQLKLRLIGKKITQVKLNYNDVIEYPSIEKFTKSIIDQQFIDIKRRGKWLIFELDNYYLLSHLRMEGKYYFHKKEDPLRGFPRRGSPVFFISRFLLLISAVTVSQRTSSRPRYRARADLLRMSVPARRRLRRS